MREECPMCGDRTCWALGSPMCVERLKTATWNEAVGYVARQLREKFGDASVTAEIGAVLSQCLAAMPKKEE